MPEFLQIHSTFSRNVIIYVLKSQESLIQRKLRQKVIIVLSKKPKNVKLKKIIQKKVNWKSQAHHKWLIFQCGFIFTQAFCNKVVSSTKLQKHQKVKRK